MKRISIIILAVVLLMAGCAKPESNNMIKPVYNIKPDNITIGYGFSSHAMFSADQEIIDDLLNRFNSLSFDKTTEKLDHPSAFSVYFSCNGKKLKSFWVDKNGVFWLDGKTRCYKVSSGTFDYQHLKTIFEDSR